jgi:hypothetical protein
VARRSNDQFPLQDFLSSPITALFFAALVSAVALSGKFRVKASRWIFMAAWIIAIYGMGRSEWARTRQRFLAASFAITIGMVVIGAWARPEAVPIYFGKITPRRQLLLSSENPDSHIVVRIGDSHMDLILDPQEKAALFEFAKDSHLTIEKIAGDIKVSTQIKDRNGNVVAELARNEWQVSPPNTWDRNYTDDALEVIDGRGRVVLQVQAFRDGIKLQGEWWNKDRGVRIASMKNPSTGELGGAFIFLRPTNDPDEPRIKPIFEYPSSAHFGELRKVEN